MKRVAPDQRLLSWMGELPSAYRDVLVRRYIFMSSADSSEFSLNGEEAWQHFRSFLLEPEFPLRRVARLLMVRALMSFSLEYAGSEATLTSQHEKSVDLLYSFDAAYALRICQSWDVVCHTDLSDAALRNWLLILQGEAPAS